MFGFNKTKQIDVRLTDKELKQLMKTMSPSERKKFEKIQKQVKKDREWNTLLMAEMFFDDF